MPLKLEKDNTYHRADGSVVHIGFSGPYHGTSFVVFKESADSEQCWSSGGSNFPGGIDPTKTLTGWVHPAIAARLKAVPVVGTAKTDRELLDAIRELVKV